ncbi:MAG: hypothetical protein P8188_15605, partial [Gemmatimonadota bacterium]
RPGFLVAAQARVHAGDPPDVDGVMGPDGDLEMASPTNLIPAASGPHIEGDERPSPPVGGAG